MSAEKLAPDHELAERTLEKLVAEGLIPQSRRGTVLAKLLAGTATEGDWRSWAYSSQVAEESEEEIPVNGE